MMTWVSFNLDGFTWTGPGGEPSWHYTWPDSKHAYCSSCGTQLRAQDDGADSIALTFFALDDPSDIVPVNQSFRTVAVSWLPRSPTPSTAPSAEPRMRGGRSLLRYVVLGAERLVGSAGVKRRQRAVRQAIS